MALTQTLLNPATAADSATFDASAYPSVVVFASGLAGAEEVEVMIGGGDVPVAATGPAGTALVLTATAPSANLAGGPMYILNKGVTAGASGVYAAPAIL